MEFAVIWIICGVIAGMIATNKGGNGFVAFFVGLLFGPLGIIASIFMKDEKKADLNRIAAGTSKKCPRCAELVKPDALVCRHCGHEFEALA
ncbi:MAG: zinc ribbon domain-containing protein [Sphingobium sp.]|nr:MAG: zinc ribbon domain-containing protein [Sphingobium sp.]